jgi:hypothetical protein
VKERQRHYGQATRGKTADGRMHPFGNYGLALELRAQPKQ